MAIEVSPIQEVLERLRLAVLDQLRAIPVQVPPDGEQPGGCSSALRAWIRLRHRAVARRPRRVSYSAELRRRVSAGEFKAEVAAIQTEFERGDDLTHRQTRQFYKAGFNDFLFNNFGVHHLHLGAPAMATDRTGQHAMSGGQANVLFAIIEPREVFFLDVLGHDVFDRADLTKELLRTAIRNWPGLLPSPPRVVSTETSFEAAFRLAKAGLTTCFDVDGVILLSGGNVLDGAVNNGVRAACTSGEVAMGADAIMNSVAFFVRHVSEQASTIVANIEHLTGRRPSRLELEVIGVHSAVTALEKQSGIIVSYDGRMLVCAEGRGGTGQTSPTPNSRR